MFNYLTICKVGLFFSMFLLIGIFAKGNLHQKHWVGNANKYLKIEYALECLKDSNNIYFIVKYTNISNDLIGFNTYDLGLNKNIVKALDLVPLSEYKGEGIDRRGSDVGYSHPDYFSPQENDLDYYLNKSKTIFYRYSITDNHYFDPSTNYEASYSFSFSVKDEKIVWSGKFDFLLNVSCFSDKEIVWHPVNENIKGLYNKHY